MTTAPPDARTGVELYWIPLGAGPRGAVVRTSGRVYEALVAARRRCARSRLYHSALVVELDRTTFTIEMAPVWSGPGPAHTGGAEGAVGLPVLGRWTLFRYEVRCRAGGTIPDLRFAVDSPRRLSEDADVARRVLDLVPSFPRATWGLDEQRTGDMWNSNSLTSWLLASSGHDTGSTAAQPPAGGRAPGWAAGLEVAARGRGRPVRPSRPGRGGPVPTG